MVNWLNETLLFFGRHSAWLLIPAAIIIYTWVLEAKKRKNELNKEEWDRKVNISRAVKYFSYIGMIYGFFLMIGAVMMEITGSSPSLAYKNNFGPLDGGVHQDVVNHFTAILYFVSGMVMFFKPIKDVPFTALISLLIAVGAT
ncbi:MAG: hypothetical protein ACTSXU_15765, partial [Promethearchaeota archaeon]